METNVLINLDRLRQLIKNMRAEGKYTMVKAQEDYYNDIRSRERIKEIIKGTIHENDID
jgi:hypothetical protein